MSFFQFLTKFFFSNSHNSQMWLMCTFLGLGGLFSGWGVGAFGPKYFTFDMDLMEIKYEYYRSTTIFSPILSMPYIGSFLQ